MILCLSVAHTLIDAKQRYINEYIKHKIEKTKNTLSKKLKKKKLTTYKIIKLIKIIVRINIISIKS